MSDKVHNILNEGSRDNALEMFMPILQKRGVNVSLSQLKQILLNKFVTEANINNLSLRSNYYLVGVARYYFNGDLTSNVKLNILYPNVRDKFNQEVCSRLNALIEILRNAYIDTVGKEFEQPEDFGTLTIQQLFRKYNKKINQVLGLDIPKKEKEVPQINQDHSAGRNYTYEILYSYDDAQKYKEPTSPGAWCITYGQQHFNGYVRRLKIHYVIFRMNGYENVPRKRGDGFSYRRPHDLYGNSLIAVLQSNEDGRPVYITSRWNHGSTVDGTAGIEADHAYTTEEFLNIIGDDGSVLQRAFKEWKDTVAANKKSGVNRKELNAEKLTALRTFKYYQMLMNNGVHPKELHDKYKVGFAPFNKSSAEDVKRVMGSYLVTIQLNGKRYATVMDKKQMLFDKILFVCSGYCVTRYDNYCVIGNKEIGGYWIFDTLRHRFADADGIIKFKYASYKLTENYDQVHYAVVALSGNQKALLNLDKMEFVKSRYGDVWFEDIGIVGLYYRSGTDVPNDVDDSVLYMTYDSSAREIYVYNTSTNAFVKTSDGDFKFIESINPYFKQNSRIDGYLLLTDNENIKYINTTTNEPLVIDGHDVFADAKGTKDVIGFRLPNQELCYYWDTSINDYVKYSDKSLICTKKYIWLHAYYGSIQDYVYISLSNSSSFNWHDVAIYNRLTHKLYSDDISGKIFSVYGVSGGRVHVYYPHRTETYAIKTSREDYEDQKRLQGLGESFKNGFKKMVNEMNDYYKKVL